jgi:hypothetical protein
VACSCQALRSVKAPDTAYDGDVMAKDPQPDDIDSFGLLRRRRASD